MDFLRDLSILNKIYYPSLSILTKTRFTPAVKIPVNKLLDQTDLN